MKRVPPLLLHGPFTHQTDRAQYVADIDRYAFMRRVRIDYRQVTKEHLAAPRNLVRMVHRLATGRRHGVGAVVQATSGPREVSPSEIHPGR